MGLGGFASGRTLEHLRLKIDWFEQRGQRNDDQRDEQRGGQRTGQRNGDPWPRTRRQQAP